MTKEAKPWAEVCAYIAGKRMHRFTLTKHSHGDSFAKDANAMVEYINHKTLDFESAKELKTLWFAESCR